MSDPREEFARKIEELRAKVGVLHATYEYPSREIAKAVWEELDRNARLVSCWRHENLQRTHYYVTVMGEDDHQPKAEYRKAVKLMANGRWQGVRVEVAEEALEAMRDRRFNTAMQGILRAAQEGKRPGVISTRGRFGNRGAFIGPDGEMIPRWPGRG